jgi:quercetin 2,3-dioxygenase
MQADLSGRFTVQRSPDRALFDFGWLKTYHSFSFADYFDPANLNWGALRVFNDDRVQPGKGFGKHPHRDMEIVTFVLEGELEHEDSMGNKGVVGPGGAQFMSAGTGITHSEFNHSATAGLHFLQMWVLPGKLGVRPTYGQHAFTPEQFFNRWQAVASGQSDVEAPIRFTRDATLLVARLENHALRHVFEPGRLGFLFVASGSVDSRTIAAEIEGPVESLSSGDSVRIGGVEKISVSGNGEVVLWDVPPVADAPAEA